MWKLVSLKVILRYITMRTIISSIFLLLLIGCSNGKETKSSVSLTSDTTNVQKYDTVQTVVKDSIDILMEERKAQTFNGTIFAGLKLGCSEKEYNRVISKYRKEFNNSIYITKNDSLIKVINIGLIEPKFYNGRLYELNVYIDDDYTLEFLLKLFNNKYGTTKSNYFYEYIWEYTTVQIKIKNKSRQLYSRTNNSSSMYYSGYTGGSSFGITKDSDFIHIKYSDLSILKEIENDKQQKDSLNRIKERQINQEKVIKAERQKDLI